MNKKKVFILSGPAWAGKNTLWDLLKPLCHDFVEESISMTTRAPRVWEVDGEHYHFISEERFREMIQQDAFLEYARVHEKYFYGSPKSELERIFGLGKNVIYIIEVQWAAIIRPILEKEGFTVISIFLLPPSIEEMQRRIRGRGSESEELFQIRLESAMKEFKEQDKYDIRVVNDDLEKTKEELLAILHM